MWIQRNNSELKKQFCHNSFAWFITKVYYYNNNIINNNKNQNRKSTQNINI